MMARRSGVAAATFIFATAVIAGAACEGRAQAPDVDPEATRILKSMADHIGSLKSFSVTTQNMLDDVYDSGQKIQRDFSSSVLISRPDKLRAERLGDIVDQVVLYDGKTLTVHNRGAGYYATTETPGDLDATLHFARDTLGMVPPTSDLIFTNSFELLMNGVTSGGVVGESYIGGVECTHLAFRGAAVDWQIWISAGDDPLPYKYVLTTRNDPVQPQYIVLMRDWNTKAKARDSDFDFKAPKDAERIDFILLDAAEASVP